jgi:hypothetical protein
MPASRLRSRLHVTTGRRENLLVNVLGDAYQGILVSDCLSAYERIGCRQQKCYAHHLKAIAHTAEDHPNSTFLVEAQILLKRALAAEVRSLEPGRRELSRATPRFRAQTSDRYAKQ